MSVNENEVNDLVKQTAVAAPPPDKDAASAADPQTAAALAVLHSGPKANAIPGANSKPNPPFQNQGPKNPEDEMTPDQKDPDSYSPKYGATLGEMLMARGLGNTPSVMTPFITAALPSMSGQAGESDWATARKNADATTPTQAPQKPDRIDMMRNGLNGMLGDLGAAVSPLDAAGHRPGGALAGAANVAKAASTRNAQEERDRIATATANATMLHEQAAMHKIGEDAINAATETGKRGLDMMMNAHVPGTKLADGVNSDQLNQMIQKGQIDPSEDTVFLTGRTLTGKDANGLPMFRSTYTVVKPGGPIKLTEKDAAYLNERLGTNYGGGHKDEKGNWVSDGQELPAAIMNQQWQRAQVVDANNAYADKAALAAGEVRQKLQQNTDAAAIAHSDKLTQVLNDTAITPKPGMEEGDDPYHMVRVYNILKGNKELIQEMGVDPANFSDAFAQFAGGKDGAKAFWDTYKQYQEERQKTLDKASAVAVDPKMVLEKPDEVAGLMKYQIQDYSNKVIEQQKIVDDPNQSQDAKAAAQVQVFALRAQSRDAQAQLDKAQMIQNEKKTSKSELGAAEQKAKDEAALSNLPNLINSALNYDLDPEKQFGTRQDLRAKFMEQVEAEAKRRGLPWRQADYDAKLATVKDYAASGKTGKNIGSLETFVGHAGQADGLIGGLYNTRSEWLNKPINAWMTSAEGKSQAPVMAAALAVASEEWIKFIQGTGTLTDHDKETAEKIVNRNSSPQVIHDALKEMAETARIRALTLNDSYKRTMDKSYDRMFSKNEADILKNQFGIDVRDPNLDYGGVMGERKGPPQPKITSVPQDLADKNPHLQLLENPKTHAQQYFWVNPSNNNSVLRPATPDELK